VHKRLLLLGLLRRGPLSGYELHRIVRAHGDLYADMKKANIYYLLGRLADEGLVSVAVEHGTRGRRGERLIYELTKSGGDSLEPLLEEVILDVSATDSAVAVAFVFLPMVAKGRALALLRKRRRGVVARRELAAAQLTKIEGSALVVIAVGHLVSRLDAELQWLQGAIDTVAAADWRQIRSRFAAR
jgi:DNA-binding PadR family transcriptional regulator